MSHRPVDNVKRLTSVSRSFFPSPCPAWPVTEHGPVLVERRGGAGLASVAGDAAKGGRGNGWSAIRTTQEPMPDGPLEVGGDSRAWVNAAREAWKAKPAVCWQRSLMRLGRWRRELDRRSSELRQVEQRGSLRGNLPIRRGSGPRSRREGKAFPTYFTSLKVVPVFDSIIPFWVNWNTNALPTKAAALRSQRRTNAGVPMDLCQPWEPT